MITWLDSLLPYASGGLCGSYTRPSPDEIVESPCMKCGAVDELSFSLCWNCVKEKNGLPVATVERDLCAHCQRPFIPWESFENFYCNDCYRDGDYLNEDENDD